MITNPDEWQFLESSSDPRTSAWLAKHGEHVTDLPAADMGRVSSIAAAIVDAQAGPFLQTVPHALNSAMWMFDFRHAHEDRHRTYLLPRDGLGYTTFPTEAFTWTTPPAEARALFDDTHQFGATAATDRTLSYRLSHDCSMCVYKECRGGSSWQTLRVRDTATAIDFADAIAHTRDSNVAWLPDDSGFLYVTVQWTGDIDAPARFPCIKHHKMHTSAEEDPVVARFTESNQATWYPYVTFTEPKHGAGSYSFLYVRAGCSKGWSLYVAPGFALPVTRDLSVATEASTGACTLPVPVAQARLVLGGFDFVLDESFVQGHVLYSMTNVHAPRNRLVAVDLDNDSDMEPGDVPCRRLWELLPEAEDPQRIMQAVHFVRFGGAVFVFVKWCVAAVTTTVALYKLVDARGSPFAPGRLERVLDALPIPDTCVTVDVAATHDEPAVIITVSGLFLPACKFMVDLGTVSVAEMPKLVHPGFLPPSAFETRVLCTDTRVPVIVFGKRLEDNPLGHPTRPRRTLLKGYGGFRMDMAHPQFDPTRVLHMQGLWDDVEGVTAADPPLFAIACIRGGRELGMTWAEEGRRRQKHRCFEDFKVASDLLVHEGLTTRPQLALQGRSNGGLLVLACITKWPDMAAAVVADVPLTDMLRFHTAGGGPNWVGEYGDPDDPGDADYLRSYSPLHNVPAIGIQVPPVLCVTSTTDQNVPPWHAYKMVATLNAATATAGTARTARLLLTNSTGHGHAPGVAAQSYTDAWVLWTPNSLLKA
jgi:prolyl oligopeptidase